MAQAPDTALTAVGSGRQIHLAHPGWPLLLICFAQETQAGIEPVEAAARECFPEASQLLIGHVVDLHKVPSLLRKVAEGVLAGEHRKAVEALEAARPHEDYVVILPDWDGSAVRALGLEDVSRTLGVVLVAGDGRILWRYQGPSPAQALSERLAEGVTEGRQG